MTDPPPGSLPADSHVHSEWSWDALNGSMERTCARAVKLGLPAIAFTEHADHTRLTVPAGSGLGVDYSDLVAPDGTLTAPPIDVDGYLDSVQGCRQRYPDLRILTGLEVGEPHWHRDVVAKLLQAGEFERVLGSLHVLPLGDQVFEMPDLFEQVPPDKAAGIMRDYLAELHVLITTSDAFEVLAHIDYPVRCWPPGAGRFDPNDFQDEYRHVLRALAATGRALEVNTAVPLDPHIVRWWRDEGGRAVTFASDAHDPEPLAHGFAEAAAMVEAHGFRPGRHPHDVWIS